MNIEAPTYLTCDPCPPNLTGYEVATVLNFLLTESPGAQINDFLLTEIQTDPYSGEPIKLK
jgi:hypothetical protein